MSKHSKDWQKVREEDTSSQEESTEAEIETLVDENTSLDHPSYESLEEQLTLAEQKAHENWEKAVRALAELDNVRRRTDRDIANAHKYGIEKFANALLPVVDSLEKALLLSKEASSSGMEEGLALTLQLFLDVLKKQGIEQMDPVGESFNPMNHEAMSMIEVPDTASNTVVEVFQKGYKLNDRVIRPARVIVAK